MDRGIAAVALAALSPAMLIIAAVVRATSRGPVVYTQIRVGQGGRPFRIYKFRTMVDGADRASANVSPADDPRVTRVGRVLRASYLDELPQLLNIVKGDMSLVGPRPETPEYVALYDASERRVLDVRPGLVGASTLGFMDEAERLAAAPDPEAYYRDVLLHERVRLDLAHLDDRSLARRAAAPAPSGVGDPAPARGRRRSTACKPLTERTQFGGCQPARFVPTSCSTFNQSVREVPDEDPPQVPGARAGCPSAGALAPGARDVEHTARGGGAASSPCAARPRARDPGDAHREFGLGRPSALAWSPRLRALLVADGRRVLRLAPSGRALGTVRLASTPRRSTLAVSTRSGATSYLAGSDLVTYAAGSLRRARPVGLRAALRLPVGQVRGATYDARGRLVVLDGTSLVQRGRGGVLRTAVPALRGHDLVGLTSWPGHNLLFTYDRDTRMLVGVRRDGSVGRRFDLRRVHAVR